MHAVKTTEAKAPNNDVGTKLKPLGQERALETLREGQAGSFSVENGQKPPKPHYFEAMRGRPGAV